MALFQYKISWKIMRQRENKNYRSFCPYPAQNRKFQKNSKKIQNIKNYHYGCISSQNWLEKDEKERK